jgi:hypothetical protein
MRENHGVRKFLLLYNLCCAQRCANEISCKPIVTRLHDGSERIISGSANHTVFFIMITVY